MAAILGAGGLITAMAALFKSFFERPKTRADAIKAINEAAASSVTISAGQVASMATRLADVEERMTRAERHADHMQDHIRKTDDWWHNTHTPWDERLVEVVTGERDPRTLGPLVPPPPPLFEEFPGARA